MLCISSFFKHQALEKSFESPISSCKVGSDCEVSKEHPDIMAVAIISNPVFVLGVIILLVVLSYMQLRKPHY